PEQESAVRLPCGLRLGGARGVESAWCGRASSGSNGDGQAIIGEGLVCRALALFSSSFHGPVVQDGTMLTGKVALVLSLPYRPRESCLLTDFPIGVRTEQEGIGQREVKRCPPVP